MTCVEQKGRGGAGRFEEAVVDQAGIADAMVAVYQAHPPWLPSFIIFIFFVCTIISERTFFPSKFVALFASNRPRAPKLDRTKCLWR